MWYKTNKDFVQIFKQKYLPGNFYISTQHDGEKLCKHDLAGQKLYCDHLSLLLSPSSLQTTKISFKNLSHVFCLILKSQDLPIKDSVLKLPFLYSLLNPLRICRYYLHGIYTCILI